MTKREGAIISAHTGILCTAEFSAFHEYAEEILGRPLFTHQFGEENIMQELKNKSQKDFLKITLNQK